MEDAVAWVGSAHILSFSGVGLLDSTQAIIRLFYDMLDAVPRASPKVRPGGSRGGVDLELGRPPCNGGEPHQRLPIARNPMRCSTRIPPTGVRTQLTLCSHNTHSSHPMHAPILRFGLIAR